MTHTAAETAAAYLSGVDLTGLAPEQALRLGSLVAELLELAEVSGYRKAITALRDDEAFFRWLNKTRPARRGIAPSPLDAADYLEAIAEETQ